VAEWLEKKDAYGPSEGAEEGDDADDDEDEDEEGDEEGDEAEEDPPTAVEKWFNEKVCTRDSLALSELKGLGRVG